MRLECALCVALGLIGPPAAIAGDSEGGLPTDSAPFSLTSADLLKAAAAPLRQDDYPAVTLLNETRYEIDESQRVTETTYRIYRVDSPAANEVFGQTAAAWDPSHQDRPRIRARVVTPDGREHQFDPANLTEGAIGEFNPRLFIDVRLIRGPLPAIAPGSVVEVETVVADREPSFSGGLTRGVYMSFLGAVERTRIVVTAPASLPLQYSTRLMPEARITDVRREDGLREITLEHGPTTLDARQVIVEAMGDQPVLRQFQFSTGASWQAVAAAYASLTAQFIRPEEVRSLLPAQLPASREQLIADLNAIVHERVRYTSVAFGLGGIVPQPPAVTLQRRFGDCKDKAVVLVSLLRAAGIEAELALVNASGSVDIDPALPGISAFDHVIVRVEGSPTLWIDPTAEFLTVGELPFADKNRWALVIGDRPEPLQRTPEARPADNFRRESHEIRLVGYGLAAVQIKALWPGSSGAFFRQLTAERSEAAVRRRDEFLTSTFGVTSVERFDVEDAAGKAGFSYRADLKGLSAAITDIREARVKVSLASLFGALPFGLKFGDNLFSISGSAAADSEKDPAPPRTTDWIFEPYVSEWELKILAPAGFRLKSIPEASQLQFGPARLSQEYGLDADGNLTGKIRLDTVRGRYSANEGRAFLQAFEANATKLDIAIQFEHEVAALIAAGDGAGALRRSTELINSNPNEAIHRIRAAEYLIELGLVDEARIEARKATEIEPQSSLAFYRLGWVLEHDDLGRRYGRGFDREGAIRAHREALRLEQEDNKHHFVNIGGAAEYNKAGVRYGKGAELDTAIENYREYLKKSPDQQDVLFRLLRCLWHTQRFDEMPELLARMRSDEYAGALHLALRVMKIGAQQAIREDASLMPGSGRKLRVERAIYAFRELRDWEKVRDLLEAGTNEGLLNMDSNVVETYRRVQPAESFPVSDETAVGAAQNLLRTIWSDAPDQTAVERLLSERAQIGGSAKWLAERIVRYGKEWVGGEIRDWEASAEVALDLTLASLEYQEKVLPGGARHVTLLLRDHAAGILYLVPEKGGWRVLTYAPNWQPVGRHILGLLDTGDLAAARTWLDTVRDDINWLDKNLTLRSRLLQQALPQGPSSVENSAARAAAYLLLVWFNPIATDVASLRREIVKASAAEQQRIWNPLLVLVAIAEKDSVTAIDTAMRLQEADPPYADSYFLLAMAYRMAERWPDVERISRERIAKRPSEDEGPLNLSESLIAQGRGAEGLVALAQHVQRGRNESWLLNLYAWQALVADAVDDAAISAAERAFRMTNQSSFGVAHTLACLYAVTGRVTDARRVFIDSLKKSPWIDPTSDAIWLLRGLTAEKLNARETAVKAYKEIHALENENTQSSFSIASARLRKLASAGP